jgi:hypothetical protein
MVGRSENAFVFRLGGLPLDCDPFNNEATPFRSLGRFGAVGMVHPI